MSGTFQFSGYEFQPKAAFGWLNGHYWGSQSGAGVCVGRGEKSCTHFPVRQPGSLEHLSRRLVVDVSFQLVESDCS